MSIEKLQKYLSSGQNIFDFIICIFRELYTQEEGIYTKEYQNWIKDSQNRKQELQIGKSIAIYYKHYAELCDYYIDILHHHHKEKNAILIAALNQCDNIIGELIKEKNSFECYGEIVDKGPLNLNAEIMDAYLYLNGPRHLNSTLFEKYKIRARRSTRGTFLPGICRNLKNLLILPKNSLGGYEPRIIQYYPSNPIGETVKVALIPFSKAKWFDAVDVENNNLIDIIYNADKEKINLAINRAINKAEELDADIVIFPELVMNNNTLTEVKQFLRKGYFNFHSLKLVFLGSNWDNNSNVAYILSSTGKVLLEVSKKIPFDQYIQNSNTPKTENIIRHDNKIPLLDIEGLGRISYLICKDSLEPHFETTSYAYLMANISVISAFSPKVAEFQNMAGARAKMYGASTFMCNGCAAIKDRDTLIGNVVIPRVNENKDMGEVIYPIKGKSQR